MSHSNPMHHPNSLTTAPLVTPPLDTPRSAVLTADYESLLNLLALPESELQLKGEPRIKAEGKPVVEAPLARFDKHSDDASPPLAPRMSPFSAWETVRAGDDGFSITSFAEASSFLKIQDPSRDPFSLSSPPEPEVVVHLMDGLRPSSVLSSDDASDSELGMYAIDMDDRFTPSQSLSPVIPVAKEFAVPLAPLPAVADSSSTLQTESTVMVETNCFTSCEPLASGILGLRVCLRRPPLESNPSFLMPKVDLSIPELPFKHRLQSARPLFPSHLHPFTLDTSQRRFSETGASSFNLIHDSNDPSYRRLSESALTQRYKAVSLTDSYGQARAKRISKIVKQQRRSLRFSRVDRCDPLNLTLLFSSSGESDPSTQAHRLLDVSWCKLSWVYGGSAGGGGPSKDWWINLSLIVGVSLAGLWLLTKNLSAADFWASEPSPLVEGFTSVGLSTEFSYTGTTRADVRELKRLMGKVLKEYLVGVLVEMKGHLSRYASDF